jgi:hypothetical protein
VHHGKMGRSKSVQGRKRTSRSVCVMSAVPSKEDIQSQSRNVCSVPILLQKSVADFGEQ